MKNKKTSINISKKAASDQIFATLFFIAAFAIIVAVLLYSNSLNNPIKQEISSLHIKLDDEENFANLMQSFTDYTNSQTMTDLLVGSIITNQYLKFDAILIAKLQRDYSKEIYWEYEILKIAKGEKFDA